MRSGRGRRVLPEHQLVLADDLAVRLASAVAGGSAAGGDPDIGASARALGDPLGLDRAENEEDEEGGEEPGRAQPDRDVAPAPHHASVRLDYGPNAMAMQAREGAGDRAG